MSSSEYVSGRGRGTKRKLAGGNGGNGGNNGGSGDDFNNISRSTFQLRKENIQSVRRSLDPIGRV